MKKISNTKSRRLTPKILSTLRDEPTMSFKEIGEMYEIGSTTIRKIAKDNDMSLSGRKSGNGLLKVERNEEIIALLKENNSIVSIANKFKVSKARIQQVAKKNGISRWEMSRERYRTTLKAIEVDFKGGLGYDEIRDKYNLDTDSTLMSGLRNIGFGAFAKRFRDKRDEVIVKEYKTKIAKVVLKSTNPIMNSPERLNNLGSIYKISTRIGFKKYPNVGNRSGGGLFEKPEIIKFIKTKRDKHKLTFSEIATLIQSKGWLTPYGKEYTTSNVYQKYKAIKKHNV